jgi:hypothetical protein
MTHHTVSRIILRTGFLVLVFLFAAMLSPAMAQCERPDDVRIVSEIMGRIAGDKALASQRSHINVVSLNGAVKLQGWTDTKSDYTRLYGYAFNAQCVTMVNENNITQTPPPADGAVRSSNGCGTGMKACGDICIPSTDTCSISSGEAGQ